MEYTAEIIGKDLVNGMLRVSVKYTNGTDTFFDYVETNQAQNDDWPNSIIKRKLNNLNQLPTLKDSINLSQVSIENKTTTEALTSTIETVDDLKEEYKKDLQTFEKYVNVLSKGFTTEENENFIALKKKLTDNFSDDYLDLF